MNAGLIASRYANALYLFACETHEEQKVYEDARALKRAVLEKGDVTACIESLSAPMQRFLALVIRNKRVEYLPSIMHNYRVLYRKEKGITRAWLSTAVESPGLVERLTELMKRQGFSEVDFKSEVNPALIGGFIVQVEDKRLDASIASQLKQIRKDLENNIRKNHENG